MNKNSFISSIVGLLTLFIGAQAFAQDKTLVGKITVFDSIPLIGVNVMVKSTGQTVKTDSLGRFQLFCNVEDKIRISADGFYTKNVKIEKGIRMVLVDIDLKKGAGNLAKAENYVQIGYGQINALSLMNAVSSVNEKEMNFSKYTDIFELIQGLFPGVSVEGNDIVVRGGSKTFYGSDAALLVIDGVIVDADDFASLSPFDVQSIDVLKDGSSSVYGSRGANGAVLVQTKKGK